MPLSFVYHARRRSGGLPLRLCRVLRLTSGAGRSHAPAKRRPTHKLAAHPLPSTPGKAPRHKSDALTRDAWPEPRTTPRPRSPRQSKQAGRFPRSFPLFSLAPRSHHLPSRWRRRHAAPSPGSRRAELYAPPALTPAYSQPTVPPSASTRLLPLYVPVLLSPEPQKEPPVAVDLIFSTLLSSVILPSAGL